MTTTTGLDVDALTYRARDAALGYFGSKVAREGAALVDVGGLIPRDATECHAIAVELHAEGRHDDRDAWAMAGELLDASKRR